MDSEKIVEPVEETNSSVVEENVGGVAGESVSVQEEAVGQTPAQSEAVVANNDNVPANQVSSEEGTRIYVKNIPSRVVEDEFRDIFAPYGDVKLVRLLQGYGFIVFDHAENAQRAIDALNGTDLFGESEAVIVELSKPKEQTPRFRAVVLNISPNTSWQDLKDFVRNAGFEVLFSVIDRDRDATGIVEFASQEELERGIAELTGRDLDGAQVTLEVDTRPPPRKAGGRRGGRGGSRGGGRGGSSFRGGRFPDRNGGGRYGGRDFGRPYDRRPPRDGGYRGNDGGDRYRNRRDDRRDDRPRYRSRSPRRDPPPPPPMEAKPSW